MLIVSQVGHTSMHNTRPRHTHKWNTAMIVFVGYDVRMSAVKSLFAG